MSNSNNLVTRGKTYKREMGDVKSPMTSSQNTDLVGDWEIFYQLWRDKYKFLDGVGLMENVVEPLMRGFDNLFKATTSEQKTNAMTRINGVMVYLDMRCDDCEADERAMRERRYQKLKERVEEWMVRLENTTEMDTFLWTNMKTILFAWVRNNLFTKREDESVYQSVVGGPDASQIMSLMSQQSQNSMAPIKGKEKYMETKMDEMGMFDDSSGGVRNDTNRMEFSDVEKFLVIIRECGSLDGRRSLETGLAGRVSAMQLSPPLAYLVKERMATAGVVNNNVTPGEYVSEIFKVMDDTKNGLRTSDKVWSLDMDFNTSLEGACPRKMGLYSAMRIWTARATIAVAMGKTVRIGHLMTFLKKNLASQLLKNMDGIFRLAGDSISMDTVVSLEEEEDKEDDVSVLSHGVSVMGNFQLGGQDKLERIRRKIGEKVDFVPQAWISLFSGGNFPDYVRRMVQDVPHADDLGGAGQVGEMSGGESSGKPSDNILVDATGVVSEDETGSENGTEEESEEMQLK